MIKEKTLGLLIEGELMVLEDSMIQDPRNILYPDNRTSEIYKHLNNLIKQAKKENIDISIVRANYMNLFNKYRIAV